MKKLVFSAAALTLTGTAVANDSDWAQLDQDIQALSASVQGLEDTGMHIGGRVRALYQNSGDIAIAPSGNDLGGFSIRNARLYAHGTVAGDIGYRVELDFANPSTFGVAGADEIGLLDAYLDIPVGGEISARVGQFRAHVLRESLIDSGNLFFVERSAIGAHFAGRSQGVAIHGDFDAFEWAVTIQNGADTVGDELFYALRGEIDLAGEGTDLIEGAYGASEEMEASAAVSYFSDEAVEDADGFAVEGSLATNQFSVQAAFLSLGDAISTSNVDQEIGNIVPLMPDSSPFTLQGTFMLSEASSDYGAWELGARFQDLDDDVNDTTVLDFGANYYANGHDYKYIINWTSISSDAGDADIISLGVNARF